MEVWGRAVFVLNFFPSASFEFSPLVKIPSLTDLKSKLTYLTHLTNNFY